MEKVKDTHTQALNRPILIDWLCKYGDPVCKKHTVENVQAVVNEKGFMDWVPNIAKSIVCGGLRFTGQKEWDYFFGLANKEDYTRYRKQQLHRALVCSQDRNNLLRYVE